MTKPRSCPRCGSTTARRSHRKHIEFLFIHVRPFRCSQCDRRFYSKLHPNERAAEARAVKGQASV